MAPAADFTTPALRTDLISSTICISPGTHRALTNTGYLLIGSFCAGFRQTCQGLCLSCTNYLYLFGGNGGGERKDGDLGEEKALKFQRNYMAECCFQMLTYEYWLSLWSENCTQKQCANSQRDMFYGEITPTWKYNRCAQVFVYVRVSVFHLLAG